MARLLRDLDYNRIIQADNLLQIIESNQQTKIDVEQAAQAEMIGYLSQRYKVGEIFSNTSIYSSANVYYGKNLVEYTETAFNPLTTYVTANRVLYNGFIYSSIAGSVPHAFLLAEWNLICADKSLFYVTLPNPEFDYNATYQIGDIVWYENNYKYTCVKPCKNINPLNTEFWGTPTLFSITGQLPTNTTYWTVGDNRNQQIVLFLIDVTLYHLHSRINPRNIPDLRKERYNGNSPTDSGGAIGWLKSVSKGNVNADLPVFTPEQGMSIRYGNAANYYTPNHNQLW